MSYERNLGKDQGEKPKGYGFQFEVENSSGLCGYMINTANSKRKMDLATYRKLNVGERIWEKRLTEDALFRRMELELDGQYSVKEGQEAYIEFDLDFTTQALLRDSHLKIANFVPQIAKQLVAKGWVGAYDTETVEGIQVIVISPQENGGPEIRLSAGWKSLKEAWVLADKDEVAVKNAGLIVSTTAPATELATLTKTFQTFQRVAEDIVDSTYSILGLNSPNTVFNISKKD